MITDPKTMPINSESNKLREVGVSQSSRSSARVHALKNIEAYQSELESAIARKVAAQKELSKVNETEVRAAAARIRREHPFADGIRIWEDERERMLKQRRFYADVVRQADVDVTRLKSKLGVLRRECGELKEIDKAIASAQGRAVPGGSLAPVVNDILDRVKAIQSFLEKQGMPPTPVAVSVPVTPKP